MLIRRGGHFGVIAEGGVASGGGDEGRELVSFSRGSEENMEECGVGELLVWLTALK